MSQENQILRYIDSQKDKIVDLMQKLVQTESTTGNEARIGHLVAEECRRDGLEVELVEPAKDRTNVVARYHGTRGKPKVMMYSHYDTVPSGDLNAWTYPPYSGKIVDGQMWGRGTADNKIATCGLIMAFRGLRSLGIKLRGDIVFTHVADEEKGGTYGFRYLVDNGYGDDVECLFYGHGGSVKQIGIAANGSRSYTIRVKGKAAHTARLEEGLNAVVKAAELIRQLKALGDDVNKRGYHLPGTDTIMQSRFSINRCIGYTGGNVVPDSCEVIVDRRFTPGENAEQSEEEIRKVIAELKAQDKEFEADLSFTEGMELSVSPADSDLVKSIQRVAKRITGQEPKPAGGSHSSDHGWFVSKYHKPVASYGIGGVGTHMTNEHISVEDLVTTTKVYALLMIDLLGVE